MKLLLGVLADDLTGGLEVAAMLTAEGMRCAYVTHPDRISQCEGYQAIVVAQKTRVASAQDAVAAFEAAANALLALGAAQIFFKYCATFDSTDKGNIGPCTDLLMALTESRLTAFVPSFPSVGRSVYQGHLFVFDQLVSDSPKRADPLTPMTDPRLVQVLQRQTEFRVGLLPYEVLRAGGSEMEAHLHSRLAEGERYFIADAVEDRDVQELARLTVQWPLVTGNSSIVQYYPSLWRELGWVDKSPAALELAPVKGPGVVLSGSCAERTLAQLAEFERFRPVYRIQPDLSGDADTIIQQVVEWALPLMVDGPVAISTSGTPEQVEAAHTVLGREGAARKAEALLADVACALHEQGVRRFLVAGGETSGAVLDALGVQVLTPGPWTGPGAVLATTEGQDRLGFCLKSGKLGPVDMFIKTLEAMG